MKWVYFAIARPKCPISAMSTVDMQKYTAWFMQRVARMRTILLKKGSDSRWARSSDSASFLDDSVETSKPNFAS